MDSIITEMEISFNTFDVWCDIEPQFESNNFPINSIDDIYLRRHLQVTLNQYVSSHNFHNLIHRSFPLSSGRVSLYKVFRETSWRLMKDYRSVLFCIIQAWMIEGLDVLVILAKKVFLFIVSRLKKRNVE